jgi:spermidine synthase
MSTYKEIQPWGETVYAVLNGSHISFTTKRAKIDLITNPYYGRMLFIGGVLQSAESDERIYHSEIVKAIPGKPKNVLIAGGAEGALAKELFLGSVLKVVMVDWDEQLVNHMKKEPFAGDAFKDPRLRIVHEDMLEYLKQTNESFDTIILDLLDPHTDEEIEWLMNVLALCLQKRCNISMNAGGDVDILNKIMGRLYKIVPYDFYISSKTIHVPCFQQEWYLIAITHI